MFFDLLQEQSQIFISPGLIVFRLHHLHKWIEKPFIGGSGYARVFYKNKEKQRQHLFKAPVIVMAKAPTERRVLPDGAGHKRLSRAVNVIWRWCAPFTQAAWRDALLLAGEHR